MVKKSKIFMVVAVLLIANIMTFSVVASEEERSDKAVIAERSLEELKAKLEKLKAKEAEWEKALKDISGGLWPVPTQAEKKKFYAIEKELDVLMGEMFDKLIDSFDSGINGETTPSEKAKFSFLKLQLIKERLYFLEKLKYSLTERALDEAMALQKGMIKTFQKQIAEIENIDNWE